MVGHVPRVCVRWLTAGVTSILGVMCVCLVPRPRAEQRGGRAPCNSSLPGCSDCMQRRRVVERRPVLVGTAVCRVRERGSATPHAARGHGPTPRRPARAPHHRISDQSQALGRPRPHSESFSHEVAGTWPRGFGRRGAADAGCGCGVGGRGRGEGEARHRTARRRLSASLGWVARDAIGPSPRPSLTSPSGPHG